MLFGELVYFVQEIEFVKIFYTFFFSIIYYVIPSYTFFDLYTNSLLTYVYF